jgi:hypothetical protein
MRKINIWMLVCILALAGTVGAKTITLKKSFLSGWQYSVDGSKYEKVGFSGKSLYSEMSGNESAQKQMKSYKADMATSLIISFPGGFLVGWPLGAAVVGKKWTRGYTTMIAAGSVLAMVGAVFSIQASDHLKRAVNIYNGEEKALNENVKIVPRFAVARDKGMISLALLF